MPRAGRPTRAERPLSQRTREELLVLAKALKVVGRSLLTKAQLVRAIERKWPKAAAGSYRYTPMYPKPHSAPPSGVALSGTASTSPARKSGLPLGLARPSLRSGHRARSASASPVEGHPRAGSRSASTDDPFTDALPERYGQTRLILQARDPHWVHAYWELSGAAERRADGGRARLRVYELSEPQFSPQTIRRWFDVTLTPEARDWFIEVGQPAAWWCVELGILDPEGFVPLVRSNLVETPADRPSDEFEEGWPRLADALAAQMAGSVCSSGASAAWLRGAKPRK